MADTPEYLELPLPVSAGEYMDIAEGVMQDAFPDWDRNTANADVVVLEADAEIAADLSEAATTVATNIFVDSGQRLDGLVPVEGVAATGITTWTAYDTNGPYEIPAGSTVGIDVGGGQLVTFQTIEDAEVANGDTTVEDVAVVATEVGEAGNGLTGAAVIVDAPSTIASVEFTDNTGEGSEGETVEEYLNRLVLFRLLRSATPVVARDFPKFMQAEVAGVERATYLDGYHPVNVSAEGYVAADYDPDDMDTWRDKTVTVVGQDEDGEQLSSTVLIAANTLFNGDAATGTPGHREAGFVVNVLNPHYTTIAVSATLEAWEGWDPTLVQASAEAALEAFLDPSAWGQPSGDQRGWDNTTTLRGADLYAVLKSVEGVKAITALTFGSGVLGTANEVLATTLTEPVPLTRPGVMTITVS